MRPIEIKTLKSYLSKVEPYNIFILIVMSTDECYPEHTKGRWIFIYKIKSAITKN